MKIVTLLTGCVAFIVIAIAFIYNLGSVSQSTLINSDSNSNTVVNSDSDSDMKYSKTFASQQSSTTSSSFSSSSGYQKSSLNLSAANLRQPHILRINTSGSQLSGEITVNGKVVKRLNDNQVEINLSPLLSVGEHIVEISGRYAPASSGVSIELSGPGVSSSQQTSGNGVVNYTLNLSIN
ncbi:MAG: hypothetical protein HXY43_06520 [Fischerella sp.]|jgi:hypothetical protein|uniref:hypothetical protein n=1 Tax=Fischerella sp. TaxID=1191 RepID=UPI00185A657A|nr:hypothetical protein [Fischerella sp.]NWF58957.1 hypothetical protein [Fischerella sp.]